MSSQPASRTGRSSVDPSGRSSRAAGQGFRALCEGDTELARQKYTEAGDVLAGRAEAARRTADKHFLRYLAASQYYRGGEYKRALRLTRRIERAHLPAKHRPKLDEFRKEVEQRAEAGYALRTRAAVLTHRAKGQPGVAIRLLQDHPYVFERAALAGLRGELCYMTKEWYPSALFYSDAVRFSNFHPTPVFLKAMGALRLVSDNRMAEAREYVELFLANEPTPLDLVVVCAVRLTQLLAGDTAAGDDLLRIFDRAAGEYEGLPQTTRADEDVRALMSHGYSRASLAANRLGDHPRGLRYAEAGLTFFPAGPDASTFRAVLAHHLGSQVERQTEQFPTVPATLIKMQEERKKKLASAEPPAA